MSAFWCLLPVHADTQELIAADADGVFRLWDLRNYACMQVHVATYNKIGSSASKFRL